MVVATAALYNYVSVQRHVFSVISSDERNSGITVWAHYQYFIVPTSLVFDVRGLSGEKSPADVTRVLFQFAATMKERDFERVTLSSHGQPKFLLTGEYFSNLGAEYGVQNPVYTMRTLPENVYKLDGTAAFGTWTGGLLGVVGKQMEDFIELHKQWYINDIAQDGS